jgi:hypothetical protein
MIDPDDEEPWDWSLSGILMRFVLGAVVGALSGFAVSLRWFSLEGAATLWTIILCTAAFGVSAVLYGQRFWNAFLSLFSRE